MKQHIIHMERSFDVIVIGGSYAGLAAAMALGRAMRKVLVIDNGRPCNQTTPYSHNFLTNDGKTPAMIATVAKEQVMNYPTIHFLTGTAIRVIKEGDGYRVGVTTGEDFFAARLIFATGIRDLLPDIQGLEECWGKSVLHCPFCHGYEVRMERTGIFGNGEKIVEFALLISNWSTALTLFTNGPADFSPDQWHQLGSKGIEVKEQGIIRLKQEKGQLQGICFGDGTEIPLQVLYAPSPFIQHSPLPEALGCEMTMDGYVRIDENYETSIRGLYAIGDNASRMRTVANAVAMGTAAGMMLAKKMILEGETL